jgi:hypothetical protein
MPVVFESFEHVRNFKWNILMNQDNCRPENYVEIEMDIQESGWIQRLWLMKAMNLWKVGTLTTKQKHCC